MTGQDTAPVYHRSLDAPRLYLEVGLVDNGGLQAFVLSLSKLTTRGEAHEMLAAIKRLSR